MAQAEALRGREARGELGVVAQAAHRVLDRPQALADEHLERRERRTAGAEVAVPAAVARRRGRRRRVRARGLGVHALAVVPVVVVAAAAVSLPPTPSFSGREELLQLVGRVLRAARAEPGTLASSRSSLAPAITRRSPVEVV